MLEIDATHALRIIVPEHAEGLTNPTKALEKGRGDCQAVAYLASTLGLDGHFIKHTASTDAIPHFLYLLPNRELIVQGLYRGVVGTTLARYALYIDGGEASKMLSEDLESLSVGVTMEHSLLGIKIEVLDPIEHLEQSHPEVDYTELTDKARSLIEERVGPFMVE